MRLKFKSLKEYKLILLTETEYKDVEVKEQTRKQEIELSKTIEKRNAAKTSRLIFCIRVSTYYI